MKNLFFILIFSACVLSAQAKDYIVTDYSVSMDSTQLNTAAIQSVIDLAEKEGGGTIIIPKGVYLSGALFFKPNTKLCLEEGAVLKGSDDIADYPLTLSRMEGKNIYYHPALVNAYYVDGFEIAGPGKIDGNGYKFWTTFWKLYHVRKGANKPWTNLEVRRPRLVFIWGCNNVKITNVKLYNAGYWTTHLYQCNDVLIENCDIYAPQKPVKVPSSDAIDLDVCKRVVIRGCSIAVEDDAVCIKGGKGPTAHKSPENGIVEDILIENCTFGHAHGTLTMGSEAIHARNITMRNCTVNNNCALLRLKMRLDTYQIYENITIENITGRIGNVISMRPWTQFFNLEGTGEAPFGIVRNITISNVNVEANNFGGMNGNPNDIVSDVVFKDMNITTKDPAFKGNYKGIKFENVTVNNVSKEK